MLKERRSASICPRSTFLSSLACGRAARSHDRLVLVAGCRCTAMRRRRCSRTGDRLRRAPILSSEDSRPKLGHTAGRSRRSGSRRTAASAHHRQEERHGREHAVARGRSHRTSALAGGIDVDQFHLLALQAALREEGIEERRLQRARGVGQLLALEVLVALMPGPGAPAGRRRSCRANTATAFTGRPLSRAIIIGARPRGRRRTCRRRRRSARWSPSRCRPRSRTSRPAALYQPFCCARCIAACTPQGVQSRRTFTFRRPARQRWPPRPGRRNRRARGQEFSESMRSWWISV